MTHRARGTFDVILTPQPSAEHPGDAAVSVFVLDKRFHGDLDGTSRGRMLSAATTVPGSAGYVAMERVEGTLHGRRGSFVLQHTGTMARGAPRLVITVVPDSGTDALTGLAGELRIDIADGVHSYELEYTLGADA